MKKNILRATVWILTVIISIGITFFITREYYENSETRGLVSMFGKERYQMLTNIDKQTTTKYYFSDGEIIVDETDSTKVIQVP